MKESSFQSELIRELEDIFPGCIVIKNDPTMIRRQGMPDLLILYQDRWAALECKRNSQASRRPNQDYYVNKMNQMSYASFVYPENKEEVLYEIQRSFGLCG